MQLFLIDAIGPFFRAHPGRIVNWSKIPFQYLGGDTPEADEIWQGIYRDMETFCARASAMGFNAVSLDDVPHLADHPAYSAETRERIQQWRNRLTPCLEIAEKAGLRVFLTMDVFTCTQDIREHLSRTVVTVENYLAELLGNFLDDFPQVTGVILRIGESDARDVTAEFRSELHVRTPREANDLLKKLLPAFESRQRQLIFRTWTVGAYRIGDLIWNPATLRRVVEDVECSPALIISMKYGESDFFRHLPLSQNFFHTATQKIVELQTRREYEGCGEYPSFTGWEYERYARELARANNLIGIMVWCQTGGWVPFRRLALLEPEAVWTDLNTFVTLRTFQSGQPVEESVHEFTQQRQTPNSRALLELLRLADEAVRDLLYVEEFARQPLFFRRVRIPPLLQVHWHNIFINHSVKKILSHFVTDKEASLRASRRVMESMPLMKSLAAECAMPGEDIEYMEETFRLIAMAREYYFQPFSQPVEERLRAAKKAYKQKYPKSGSRTRYRIKTNFQPFWLRYRHLGWALTVFMRKKASYRMVDRLFTLHGLSLMYRLIMRRRPHWIPSFARESAMGVDTVFK